jgi:hypothetical protein
MANSDNEFWHECRPGSFGPSNYEQNLSSERLSKLFKSSYSGRLADVYETRLALNGCCGRIKKNYVECFCPLLFIDTQESLIWSV